MVKNIYYDILSFDIGIFIHIIARTRREKMKELINKELMDREEISVDIVDRDYQFGDGGYDVVRVYEGEVYELDRHVERLFRSAKEIDITFEYTIDELKDTLKKLIKENNVIDGGVYFQVTRGVAPRKHNYDRSVKSHLFAYTLYYTRTEQKQKVGMLPITVEDLRRLR